MGRVVVSPSRVTLEVVRRPAHEPERAEGSTHAGEMTAVAGAGRPQRLGAVDVWVQGVVRIVQLAEALQAAASAAWQRRCEIGFERLRRKRRGGAGAAAVAAATTTTREGALATRGSGQSYHWRRARAASSGSGSRQASRSRSGASRRPKPARPAPRVLAILGDDLLRLDSAVTAVALSANGRVGALGGKTGVDVFEVPGLRRLRFFPELAAQGRGLALSADGTLVAASVGARAQAIRRGAKHEVEVWSLRDGKRVATLNPAIEVRAAAFSPDGRLLAVGGANLGIELWDVAKGRARWRKLAHGASGEILSLAFSPDGRRLLWARRSTSRAAAARPTSGWTRSSLWNVDAAAQSARSPRA